MVAALKKHGLHFLSMRGTVIILKKRRPIVVSAPFTWAKRKDFC